MAGVSISCCVLSMSHATLQKDLLENECLSLIFKKNQKNLNVHIQPGTWCNWTELLCCVPLRWGRYELINYYKLTLRWGSYELMNYYKLTMVIIPPAASVSSVFLSRSSALACPTTLTTRPVKQHQTGIGSSKSKPSGLSDDTNHMPCQTTSNIYQPSGQASWAPWPVQPHWPHALSNNIYSNTHIRTSKSSILACPTTLTTCPVKLHPHWNTSGQASQASWPVQPRSPHILSNNTERISWSGQAPWPVHPYTHIPNNVKHIRLSKLSTLACLNTLTTCFVKQHPHSNTCHFVRPSKSSTLACPTTCSAKQLQTSIRSSKSSTFYN